MRRAILVASCCAVGLAVATWHYLPSALVSDDQRQVESGVRSRFSTELAPSMIELRWAAEKPHGVTDADLTRWLNVSQTGTSHERREAASLFMGLVIDWPSSQVLTHAETLVHIAGTLLANSDGDESVAVAGLAIACEIDANRAMQSGTPNTRTRQTIKDIADGVNRTAVTDAWKTLYAEAYPSRPKN